MVPTGAMEKQHGLETRVLSADEMALVSGGTNVLWVMAKTVIGALESAGRTVLDTVSGDSTETKLMNFLENNIRPK